MPDKFDPNKKVTIQDLENQVKNYEMFLEIQGADKPEVIKDKLIQLRRVLGLPTETKEEKRHRVIMQEIRDWVEDGQGTFNVRDLYSYLPQASQTTKEKHYIRICLNRLIKEGLLERDNKYGIYRRVEGELETIDFINIKAQPIDLWLPFGLTAASDSGGPGLVKLYNGNIVVIAGDKDSGKSTLCYNIAMQNMDNWDTHFFDSEAGAEELHERLSNFDIDLYDWGKMSVYERFCNFADVIRPGPGKLNIVDFLECHDEFYRIGGWINEIHKKLKGAIAIVAVQKKQGVDFPRGGEGVFEKARLALLVSRGKIKIASAKAWGDSTRNPRGFACQFKIVQGAKLIKTSDWGMEDKWNL